MKVHQTSAGELCRCAWCGPRLETFRQRRLEHSAAQDGRDAFVMEEAQTMRARGMFGAMRAAHGHDTGGQQLLRDRRPRWRRAELHPDTWMTPEDLGVWATVTVPRWADGLLRASLEADRRDYKLLQLATVPRGTRWCVGCSGGPYSCHMGGPSMCRRKLGERVAP